MLVPEGAGRCSELPAVSWSFQQDETPPNPTSYHPLVKAFKSTDGSMSDLYDMINDVKSTCEDPTLLGTFTENHDNPRFAS